MIPVPLIMTNKLLFVWWFTRQMSIMGMTNAPFKFKGCPAAHNGKEFVSLLCRLVHGYRTKANLLLQLVSLLTEYECRQAGLPYGFDGEYVPLVNRSLHTAGTSHMGIIVELIIINHSFAYFLSFEISFVKSFSLRNTWYSTWSRCL